MKPVPIRQYDRAAVVVLLNELVADLAANPNSDRWVNKSVAQFLEAFGAWLADSDGYFRNLGYDVPENPWEVIWHALHAAPSYE